jgi:hypothetical protein
VIADSKQEEKAIAATTMMMVACVTGSVFISGANLIHEASGDGKNV